MGTRLPPTVRCIHNLRFKLVLFKEAEVTRHDEPHSLLCCTRYTTLEVLCICHSAIVDFKSRGNKEFVTTYGIRSHHCNELLFLFL
jgi:hypothetical protein